MLTILREAPRNPRYPGGRRYECRCDCGRETIVTTNTLAKARRLIKIKRVSCGCLYAKPDFQVQEAYFRHLFKSYQRTASHRKLTFGLTFSQFKDIVLASCHYCGRSPEQALTFYKNGTLLYNGIDRINSTESYIIGNVVTCCKRCNWAKGEMTVTEFFEWVKKVHAHMTRVALINTKNGPFKPLQPHDGWKRFLEPRPYTVVIGFAYDQSGMFPILRRSNTVRSAKNALSLPSGLHEVGLSQGEQFCNELKEELNLDGIPETAEWLFVYENISQEDCWHWCLFGLAVQIKTFEVMKNMEPDKHSDIKIISFSELLDMVNDKSTTWTPGLREAIITHREKIKAAINPRILTS